MFRFGCEGVSFACVNKLPGGDLSEEEDPSWSAPGVTGHRWCAEVRPLAGSRVRSGIGVIGGLMSSSKGGLRCPRLMEKPGCRWSSAGAGGAQRKCWCG